MKSSNKKERTAYLGSIAFHIVLFFLVAFSGILAIHRNNSNIVEVELVGGSGSPRGGSQAESIESPSVFQKLVQKVVPPDSILQHVENAPNIVKETTPTPTAKPSNNTTTSSGSGNSSGNDSGNGQGNGTGIGSGDGQNPGPGTGEGADVGVPVQIPRVISSVTPIYPERAKQRGQTARFQVRMLINADGGVDSVEIQSSNVDSSFKSSTINALYQWRFEPARNKYGQPIPSYVNFPVSFQF